MARAPATPLGNALWSTLALLFVTGAWLRTTWGRRFNARRQGAGNPRGSLDGQQGI